jgi:mono/diheme cytochrome c family protein
MSRLTGFLAAGAIVMLAPAARVPAAQEPDGAALYQQHCRKCHGATGTPTARMVEMYATLKPLVEMTGVSADSIVTLLVVGGTEGMKSYKDKMSEAEMKAVAAYTLTFSKPQAP